MTIKRHLYRIVDGKSRLDGETLNAIFFDCDARLHALESLGVSWQDAVRELQDFGLARINGVLEPVLDGATEELASIAASHADFDAWYAAISVEIEQAEAQRDVRLDAVEEDISELTAAVAAINGGQEVNCAGLAAVSLDCATADTIYLHGWDRETTISLANFAVGRTVTLAIGGGATYPPLFADTILWPDGTAPEFSGDIDTVVITRFAEAVIVGGYSLGHKAGGA